MPVHSFFPTRIHAARLPRGRAALLNARLLRECLQLRSDDRAGRHWSVKNYPGGYTSYASANRMQHVSPTFAVLERWINGQVKKFARELEFDLSDAARGVQGGRQLTMTDCWVNIMPRGVTHGMHLHPQSVISGTYYVRVPRGAPGLKFEDPRLDRYMGAPPRRADAALRNRNWITLPADNGTVLLFESWLRHEVVTNQVGGERISISFNYA